MAALPLLPRAAALLLLLLAAPLLCAAQEQGPISPAPAPGAPTESTDADEKGQSIPPSVAPAAHSPAQAPAGDDGKAAETAPAEAPTPLHSTAATPAPAPGSDDDDEGGDEYEKKPKSPAPAPAPAAMEVKSGTGTGGADDQPQPVDAAENERREGMSGGTKAGVVVGVFSAAAVVCLAGVVYRKRQANIRRSRYADYSARLELV